MICWVCQRVGCRPVLGSYHQERKEAQREAAWRDTARLKGLGRWVPMAVGRVWVAA